ncbi:hypothetical protein JRO89_XS09G0246000 [Xanthoceras sorbifolium]|uniref:non-specific serine/threonine protein kinase n=1 Tax=Xanthoceras sorbifolium TaxID=99658 RepID=A0ABQ8HMV8_9ROSI|nr:hypothetical protein JRO89_XS09G0246000 [Xanthoceras sorbifolium]
MRTAVTPENVSESLTVFWDPPNPTSKYYVYLHFAEVELLVNQTREFNITQNGKFLLDLLFLITYIQQLSIMSNRYEDSNPPRITSLNLSSSGLTGEIAPYFSNLTLIQYLDLSNNSLTGSVPDFLAQLPSLKVLNLQRNKLTGSVPAELIERSKNGSLTLRITKDFEKVLGKGGFGTVYHGWLDDIQVAVKTLSSSSGQGYKEFHAEVKLLMIVYHRNLTSLVGYCIEGTNMALIYEYMSNGTLQQYLSGKNAHILSWEDRMRIAVDAAQGLEYLHSGCKPPIVHRDVKSANILLNEKLQAKIADFGLSRIFANESGTHISTVVAGTPGYLDPEYYISNWLNEKSDVYSFGVVLLEIITGRPVIIKCTDDEVVHVSQWVSSMLAEGDIKSIIDPSLSGDFDNNSGWKVVELALACAFHSSSERPTMTEVVTELKECLAVEIARNDKGRTNKTKKTRRIVTVNVESEFSPTAR